MCILKKLKRRYYLRIAESGKASDSQQMRIIRRRQRKEIRTLIKHQTIHEDVLLELADYNKGMLVDYVNCGHELHGRKLRDIFVGCAPATSLIEYMRKFSIIGNYLTLSLREDWADVIEGYLVDKNANIAPEIEMMIVQNERMRKIYLKDRMFMTVAANRKLMEIFQQEGRETEAAECVERIKRIQASLKSI